MAGVVGRRTVRDETFDVLRLHGMTRLFSNPGSTEVSLLTDLPEDLEFVLALHESSVVGMATGHAIGSGRAAIAILHTTAGLGNAVGAIATARANRAPVVVLVGQQDRRHLAFEPFLAGRLAGLAGDYPVWSETPARAQDVPGAIARAVHEAEVHRGPSLVIVPMDDWLQPYDGSVERAAPAELLVGRRADDSAIAAVATSVARASRPAIVVGAGMDATAGWDAVVDLADLLDCPVFQEPFGARAGSPQDDARFAGILPASRDRLRAALERHDLVLVLGTALLRQYPHSEGRLLPGGCEAIVISERADEVTRSPARLALLADPIDAAERIAAQVTSRSRDAGTAARPQASTAQVAPAEGVALSEDGALTAPIVLQMLADRIPANAVIVEETPSSRPDLHRLLPARSPLGFLSAAMGGLGFAMPAAIGVRMAAPERPVVAVVGDGSSLYAIQSLWSPARYRAGVVFVILSNGGYAIMDRLAAQVGDGEPPWPDFREISVSGLAEALGCPSARIESAEALAAALDALAPTLATRWEPIVLDVAVAPPTSFVT